MIQTPERPAQLVFGGKDGKKLFVDARSSLYAVRTRQHLGVSFSPPTDSSNGIVMLRNDTRDAQR